MEVTCQQCGSTFNTKPNYVARGYGKFCSRECSSESQKKGQQVSCAFCGAGVYKTKKDFNKASVHFCNKSCAGRFRKREKSGHWRGGRGEYRRIAFEHHGKKCEHCSYDERTTLLDVHHIDSNRNNNDPSNLMVLCVLCHAAVTRRLARIENRVLIWID